MVCGLHGFSDFALTPLGILTGLFSAEYPSAKRAYACFGIAAIYMLVINLTVQGMIPGAAPTPADILMPGVDWKGWACVLTLAIGPSMTGWSLINASLTHLSPSVVNILLTTEPMLTALAAIPI
ncbi:DMT family transporter, partial [Aduncisulcus paluster]